MKQTTLNIARKDKFLMVLDLPLELKQSYYLEGASANADPIQITVIGSPVPAISIPQIEMKYGGQSFHISSNSRPAYTTISVDLVIDNKFLNYWLLWSWLNKFNDQQTGTPSSNIIANLLTKFTIFALDEYHNRIMSFKYTDVFIVGLSELAYNYQTDENFSCKATFAFSQMIVERIVNSELDEETQNVCLTL